MENVELMCTIGLASIERHSEIPQNNYLSQYIQLYSTDVFWIVTAETILKNRLSCNIC